MNEEYVKINDILPKIDQQVLYIDKKDFWCDGGEDFGHPRVYYTMKDGEAVCGYCNVKYVYKEKNE